MLGVQSYGPFGEPRDPVGTPPWGFTGEWQDPAGMVYLRARWYDPALGRFHQVDPIAGDLTAPGTQHPYTYGLNSPLRYADPSGKSFPIPHVPWSNRKIVDMSGWPQWAKTAAQVVGFVTGLRVDRAENTIAWPSDEEMFRRGFQASMLGPFYEWSVVPLGVEAGLHACPAPQTGGAEQLAEGATGTVWDWIKATQPPYPGTEIPRSFEMTAGDTTFWVHPNATEHIYDYVTRGALSSDPVTSQAMLESFQAAVETATQQGIVYRTEIIVGPWELSFGEPGVTGELPVVIHALYKP